MGCDSLADFQTNQMPQISVFASSRGCMGIHVSADPCGSRSSRAVSSARRLVNKAKHPDILIGDGVIAILVALQKAADLLRWKAKPPTALL